MFCSVKGCNKLVTYLNVIEINKDKRIKFNTCDECNKVKWSLSQHHGELPKESDAFEYMPNYDKKVKQIFNKETHDVQKEENARI